jgi:hypothetical protein
MLTHKVKLWCAKQYSANWVMQITQ